jgi:RNA polymerase sigma-70 factor
MEPQSVIDSKAFEILVRLHHRRMRAYALAMVRKAEEAEDIVQDAFVTAYQNLAKFDTKRDFGMWLRGIIRNKYLERLRSQQHTTLDNSILEIIENNHREWDHALEESNHDALVALRQCIDRLGGASKRTVELYYLERFACQDVAAQLETSETAVKKRLQRAREDLGRCIRSRLGLENGQPVI